METKEVLHMLRHHRHDLMNQIQLLQGYTSMNKPEKVKQKLREMVQEADKQKKLMDLQANEFALWLIQVNMNYKRIRLDYEVHIAGEDLQYIDMELLDTTRHVITAVETITDQNELYQLHMKICKRKDTKESVELQFTLVGRNINGIELQTLLQHIGHIAMRKETNEKITLTAII